MNEETTINVNSETISTTVEKVENALAIMADKLGVASDHFYPIVVKQQLIEGWTFIGSSIPLILAATLFAFMYKKADGDERIGLFMGALILYAFGSTMFILNISQILNPEYFALMEIKSFIK